MLLRTPVQLFYFSRQNTSSLKIFFCFIIHVIYFRPESSNMNTSKALNWSCIEEYNPAYEIWLYQGFCIFALFPAVASLINDFYFPLMRFQCIIFANIIFLHSFQTKNKCIFMIFMQHSLSSCPVIMLKWLCYKNIILASVSRVSGSGDAREEPQKIQAYYKKLAIKNSEVLPRTQHKTLLAQN